MRRNLHSSSPPPPPPPLHSSSPAAASPTVTTLSSRSPSPSVPAADSHDLSSDHLPPRSDSPPRSPSPSEPHSNSSTMGSRPGGLIDNERPSIPFHQQQPLQQQLQRPQLPASSASAPPGRLSRLLPEDVTSYTDGNLLEAAVTTSGVSLVEFASVIQLQGYQEQRRAHSRLRLHRWLVSSALSARLLHCGELAHRTLVDCFRSDDKKSFASLYNALHDVRNSCDATRRYALLEPDLDLTKSKREKDGPEKQSVPTFSTFMHEIPVKIRDDLLDFISELRTNPDFLATRITNLSQSELAALTSFRPALEPIDAVMAMQVRGKAVGTALQKAQHPQGPSAVERLLSFQRHDPLSALIYTIFANSSGPDSAEDLRRTDVWATTCARLITEGKPGYERFIKSVLDAWAGMREWPGKANLELYLMQVLQDGQFLLDKPDDQPARQTTKDTIAADDFYDAAVKRLFEVIDDDPHAGGIPEGVLEIGTAILRKLDDSRKHRAQAQFLIVSRWFFSTYLLGAIIHPETQGIMMGHHISEHARQKILKEIGIRAQRQVLDMTLNWKQAAPVLPEIRTHIENILNRFKHRRSASKPILHPAKAITSPRETVEVQPFIVLCPSDIVTLVNTLFPERRPQSSHSDLQRVGGLASAGSSISGMSLAFRTPSNSGGDASSILSISASSMTSDTTSREPLLDGPGSANGPSPDVLSVDPLEKPKVTPTEEYGRRLRMSCSEMTRLLGHDASAGACHPCAENWAVLYVSPDGKELKTRMRKDAEVDDEEDEDSADTDDSEDEGPAERLDLENDYHQIKEAIAKLVKDYEIPPELVSMSESKGFSNRTASNRKDLRGYVRATVNEQLGSKNPYLKDGQSQLSSVTPGQRPSSAKTRSPQHVRSNSNSEAREQAPLIAMLEAAYKQCFSQLDYVNSHLYYKTLQQLKRVQAPSLTRNGYSSLLNYFIRGPRDSLGRASRAIEEFEAWFVWLKQSQERHDTTIEDMMLSLKTLRDKMWYITDVRNSAGYEEAKNVAMALKIMGQPTKTLDGKPVQTHKPRQFSKSSSNNFLLKTEAQTLDIMAAAADFAGPNKLADEQSTMTLHWLTQYGIENFCKGEERIHRFCLEIDRTVNKLVGDGIIDGPVLWSSELYRRDKEVLDSGRQKGDLFLTSVGTVSIPGDEEYEMHSPRPGSKGFEFPQRPSFSSLRSINRMGSQQSFDSGKWSGSRPMDLMDSLDLFSGSSPVLTIDTSNTFWSPFQKQVHSASSATSTRPRTMSSSKGTAVLHRSDMVNDDKRRFLLDLKQTLTGLLLSDLGALAFGHGSETDSWFSSELGEECIQRKEEEDRKRKRALAKKKSMRSLKSSRGEHKSGPLDALGRPERSSPAAPVATLHHAAPDLHSAGEHSTSSSDATARSSVSAAKRAGIHEFPYSMAFRRLLGKFATHPNPFSKLHALYELEMLIVASLTSRSGRQINRRDTLPTVPQSPTLGSVPEFSDREPSAPLSRAQNLEEAIANCEERRSHSMQQQNSMNGSSSPVPFRTGSGTGTRSPVGPPSTDMIVDVLQGLFRDADIRPKSLFRDLQYIASFVPASMLDKTARGKAFWDAGLAALGLKQDVCRVMVEIADEIIQFNTQNRGVGVQQHAQNGSIAPSTATATHNTASSTTSGAAPTTIPASTTAAGIPPNHPLARFTMEDAAKMLVITAKEGDAVAERELAIFYLTHPDIVERTVLPLTKPREVFRQELLQREQSKRSSGKSGKDDWAVGKADPLTMCVAQHWMEMSKKGGDQLAIKYLRARDEMERIP